MANEVPTNEVPEMDFDVNSEISQTNVTLERRKRIAKNIRTAVKTWENGNMETFLLVTRINMLVCSDDLDDINY